MSEKLFKKPLAVPKEGKKIYKLSEEDIQNILKMRGARTELDPGMGGVSPRRLEDLLKTSSELVSVDLALTSACNFRCVHCYRPDEEWGKLLLNYDVVSKVIESSAKLGVRYFVLTGGEPLMYESKANDKKYDYFNVVDKIYKTYNGNENVFVLTFSDVALISADIANKLAGKTVALCLKRDSLDHDIQDGILGVKGGSRDIEEGYANLFKAGYGKENKLAISVNHVLRKGNFNTLKGSVDLHIWIKSNGMEHSIVPIHYCGEAIDDSQDDGINPVEVKALYDILAEIDLIMYNEKWSVYSAFPKNKTCNRPGRGVHIRATGNVTACSESPLVDQYYFGNINEDDLIDIIRSAKFIKFKEQFAEREGKYICNPDVCDLNANYLCRGGCATRSAYSKVDPETGVVLQNTEMLCYSLGREDPLCPGWAVLAQKQGALREGIYENIVERLIAESSLNTIYKTKIKDKVISEFQNLKG